MDRLSLGGGFSEPCVSISVIPECPLSVKIQAASFDPPPKAATAVFRKSLIGVLLAVSGPALFGQTGSESPMASAAHGKTALVLHSYYKGYRWTDDEDRGIESVLLPALGPANVYVEYMDSKRFYGQDSLEQFPEVYRRKFKYHHFDVIVGSDNNAFDFLRQYRDELFPGTPVVFCGVNYFQESDLQGHRRFTGVSEEADVKDTLDVALRLHPLTRHLYVVNEISETGRTVHDELVKLMPLYTRVDFSFLEDAAMPDILSTLRSLPPDSLVFYSFFSHDKAGRYFEYNESAAAVAAASKAPVYGAWDFNLGFGMVGGKLISGFYQGKTAGELALRVLAGEDPDSIPVVRFSADRPNRYMFDYGPLTRFGIPVSSLPYGSIVVNRPEPFWGRHRVAAWVGTAISIFLLVTNSVLFLNIRRRKAAERALWDQQEHLEDLVTKRSVQLENLNSRLRLDILKRQSTEHALRESQELLNKTLASLRDALLIVAADSRTMIDCNPATTKLFGYSRDEVVGKSVRLLHVDDQAFDRFQELLMAGIAQKGYLHLPVFHMIRQNGEIVPTEISVMPLYAEDGSMTSWVSVIRDITEQKNTEAKLEQHRRKLRALAAELASVEARERRAIAAQLHENLGQLLATAKMKIAPLRVEAPQMAEVQNLVEEALQQTRSLTYQLSPPILYQLGIEAALQWLAENGHRQFGFQVRFTRQGESGVLGEENSVFLFSAVRELLVNVAKHAQATEVSVRVRWREDCIEVLVKDNGKGFEHGLEDWKTGTPSPDGFGLFHIRERVSDLGGSVSLRSEKGKGTAVKIHLPLATATQQTEREHEHQNSVSR